MPREQRGGDGSSRVAGLPIRASVPEGGPGQDALWVNLFDELFDAMLKCTRGVSWKDSVVGFSLRGAENVAKLTDEIMAGTYRPKQTRPFYVRFPKLRLITPPHFRDRIVLRFLVDSELSESVERSFIWDNAACQTGKGTDHARERLKCHLQRHYRRHGLKGYVLNADVYHYFQSIPHWLGESVFDRAEPWGAAMAAYMLRCQYDGDKGYNPGSPLVQLLGVAALDPIDHRIKERWRIKGYVRYMDDLKLMDASEDRLLLCLDDIARELDGMGLKLHPKKTYIKPITEPIPFLGFRYRLTETGKVVMTIDPRKVKEKRRQWSRLIRLEAEGLRPPGTVEESFQSWAAHASKGDCHQVIERCGRFIKDEWRKYD